MTFNFILIELCTLYIDIMYNLYIGIFILIKIIVIFNDVSQHTIGKKIKMFFNE